MGLPTCRVLAGSQGPVVRMKVFFVFLQLGGDCGLCKTDDAKYLCDSLLVSGTVVYHVYNPYSFVQQHLYCLDIAPKYFLPRLKMTLKAFLGDHSKPTTVPCALHMTNHNCHQCMKVYKVDKVACLKHIAAEGTYHLILQI